MGKYADPERFGVIARDTGVPVHVNSTDNPLPIYVNGARRPMSCGPKKMSAHMEATKENQQAVFLINRPNAESYLLAADLDCTRDGDPLRCLALGDAINNEVLQGRGWSERSRNGRGRYVWFRVERAAGETVEQFTATLNKFNRYLRTRYPKRANNNGVGFDAVKGTPWFTTDNPAVTEDWTMLTELLLADTHNIRPCPDWVADKLFRAPGGPIDIRVNRRVRFGLDRFIPALEHRIEGAGHDAVGVLAADADAGGLDRWIIEVLPKPGLGIGDDVVLHQRAPEHGR